MKGPTEPKGRTDMTSNSRRKAHTSFGVRTSCIQVFNECETHRTPWNQQTGRCQTQDVLQEVAEERSRQVARYGSNHDLADGTGPHTAWLLPLDSSPAKDIEAVFRQDYEDYEDEVGSVTWTHLVREEVAESFQESDPDRLREELLQVAALCVSWIESLDHRNATTSN